MKTKEQNIARLKQLHADRDVLIAKREPLQKEINKISMKLACFKQDLIRYNRMTREEIDTLFR